MKQERSFIYLASIPLNMHGIVLDWFFKNLNADFIYLIDSDAKILDKEYAHKMMEYIKWPGVFGSGFYHGPCWLYQDPGNGAFGERAWMPFVLFRMDLIRRALQDGKSFVEQIIYNEIFGIESLNKVLRLFKKNPTLKKVINKYLRIFRKNYYFLSPVTFIMILARLFIST